MIGVKKNTKNPQYWKTEVNKVCCCKKNKKTKKNWKLFFEYCRSWVTTIEGLSLIFEKNYKYFPWNPIAFLKIYLINILIFILMIDALTSYNKENTKKSTS